MVIYKVDTDIISSKLSTLKVDKAAGVDNMSPCILKAVSEETALPVAIFSANPWIQVVFLETGDLQMSHLCSRKSADMKLTIIVQLALPARFARWWSLFSEIRWCITWTSMSSSRIHSTVFGRATLALCVADGVQCSQMQSSRPTLWQRQYWIQV